MIRLGEIHCVVDIISAMWYRITPSLRKGTFLESSLSLIVVTVPGSLIPEGLSVYSFEPVLEVHAQGTPGRTVISGHISFLSYSIALLNRTTQKNKPTSSHIINAQGVFALNTTHSYCSSKGANFLSIKKALTWSRTDRWGSSFNKSIFSTLI